MERLQSSFDELRQGLHVHYISESARDQIRQLVDIQEDVARAIAQSRILGGLAFEEMHGRYDMVHEAHAETFQWIFLNVSLRLDPSVPRSERGILEYEYFPPFKEISNSEDTDSHQDGNERMSSSLDSAQSSTSSSESDIFVDETAMDIRSTARERLLHWLSSGDGIFHISGKLGSGKSTLMKYLCDHPQTRIELEKWAGE